MQHMYKNTCRPIQLNAKCSSMNSACHRIHPAMDGTLGGKRSYSLSSVVQWRQTKSLSSINVGHSKSMLMQVQDPLLFRVWGNNMGTKFSTKKPANIFPLSWWLPCGEAHIFAGNTDKWVKLQWKCAKCPSHHNSLFNLFFFLVFFFNATNNSNTVTATLVFAQYIQHRGNKSLLLAFVMQENQ